MKKTIIIISGLLFLFIAGTVLGFYILTYQKSINTVNPVDGTEAALNSEATSDANTNSDNTSASETQSTAATSADTPNVDNAPEIKITAVGDIMLGRDVNYFINSKYGGNWNRPFEKVVDMLHWGDMIFANIETPISNRGTPVKGKPINLRAYPNSVKALNFGGFNVVSIANNHILDYGPDALSDTVAILDQNKILHAGSGMNLEQAKTPAILNKKGVKIVTLAYSDYGQYIFSKGGIDYLAGPEKSGVAQYKANQNIMDSILLDVQKARKDADLLVVSFHWGTEYSFVPEPEQIEFAHKLIDNGVDIILGHHAHHFQGMEVYKGKPVIYNMGNFIFDQNDYESMDSFLLQITMKNRKLSLLNAIPIHIETKTQAVPQTGSKAKVILEREMALCKQLNTNCDIKDEMLVIKNTDDL